MTRTNEEPRLDTAKAFYHFRVGAAQRSGELTFEHSLAHVKQELLCDIFEEAFESNPTKEEQAWLDQELATVTAYLNTEAF